MMDDHKDILIVEDEPKLASLLSDYLREAGFSSNIIDNGLHVEEWVRASPPKLIILDIMLPGLDGVSICRKLRTFSEVPILMATAKTEEIDRLIGLEVGADDYVCKPFSYREIVARVRAILRRSEAPPRNNDNTALQTQNLSFDETTHKVSLRGNPVTLTAVEFKLLITLAKAPGRIFSRAQLMHHMYDEYRVVSDRTIDSHIKKLRQKLRAASGDDALIHSVYSVGYKFEQA